ncbi:MAG: 30S ribosomal protein S8 [Magnetococcales bacterium]|nr:30S ribosomal protein S8 [Magnetococcales bacterium]MBF0149947.1 30S ribosomal protein S8 [Magnetococcales bacterium]MBF0346721.1 30S ribosomal protein S8 [Magnetococcales bacterium]
MGMTDPVSDMLTRIRNAQMAGKKFVDIPLSRIKLRIGEILTTEGYVGGIEKPETEESVRSFRLLLKYHMGRPVIEEIKRISRPGRRHYVRHDKLPRVYQGLGVAIVSTSKGVMTSKEAGKQGIGGELLCTVF